MLHFTTTSRSYAVIQRWAFGISLVFGLSLVIVMTVVLGKALGGAWLSYVTSLALVTALTVLVLYVIGTETYSVAAQTKHDERPAVYDQAA